MLTRREKIVMNLIFKKCTVKNKCLISCAEMINSLYPNEYSEKEISEILNCLVLENYISLIVTEKDEKETYCITLKEKGESFQRDNKNSKKALFKKIITTILFACLSFAVGLVLKAIF